MTVDTGAYEVVHGWPRIPEEYVVGQVTGVAVDSQNRVHVFHRANRLDRSNLETPVAQSTILSIDGETGEVLSMWGENLFAVPHGLTVDHEDNVWVTDVGERVLKFSPEHELLLVIGEYGKPGLDGTHFNLPTDVAVTPAGDFYVCRWVWQQPRGEICRRRDIPVRLGGAGLRAGPVPYAA